MLVGYVFIPSLSQSVCKKSLCNALLLISDFYALNVKQKHAVTFSNILLKHCCVLFTPRSTKVPKQKILKLSVQLMLHYSNFIVAKDKKFYH